MLSRRRSRNTSDETARRSESLRMADHSTFESGRLSGVGASWQRRPFSTTWTFARGTWDARIDDGVATPSGSGEHVTVSQLERRNQLKERFIAAGIRVGDRRSIAALFTSSGFSIPENFQGKPLRQLNGWALTARAGGHGRKIFGEAAISQRDGFQHDTAWLAGLDLNQGAFRLTAVGRRYAPGFFALRGGPFSAYSSTTGGENGLFASWQARLGRRTRLTVEIDRHSRNDQDAPIRGDRWRFRANRRTRWATVELTVSSRHAPALRDTLVGNRFRRQIRLALTRQGKARARIWAELVRARRWEDPHVGFGSGTEWTRSFARGSLAVWFHYHHIDGSEARIYAYRPDVGAGLPVSLSGVGAHSGMTHPRAVGPIRLAFRYSVRYRSAGTATDWATQVEWHR